MSEQQGPIVHATNVPGPTITPEQQRLIARLSKVTGGRVLIQATVDGKQRQRVDTVVSAGYHQDGRPFVDVEQADGSIRNLHLEDFAEWYPAGTVVSDFRGAR